MIEFRYRSPDYQREFMITFDKCDWKGKYHGKTWRSEDGHGPEFVTFHYRFFLYSRRADIIDTILYCLDKDPENVSRLVSWNGATSLPNLLEINKKGIKPSRYRKYMRKLKKIKGFS